VIYLIFNEGYAASSGPDLVREDLCAEAIRLGRLLVELMPDEPEAVGLLALMLLTDARRSARVEAGQIVLLADQDRRRWDHALIAEGQELVRQCLRRGQPGSYQIQAAINAVHTSAETAALTDWPQIVTLYDQLLQVAPSPVVELNRAIAVAEVDGPEVALQLIERLDLDSHHIWHSARGEMLTRLGHPAEAARAYEAAMVRTENESERSFLAARLREVTSC
jgi:RNA polymerase sigma-70 factor (ECF subfamily)